MSGLDIWTIYERPLDFPTLFVARKYVVGSESNPGGEMYFGETLEEVRVKLTTDHPDLYRFERHPCDEAQIVESWL